MFISTIFSYKSFSFVSNFAPPEDVYKKLSFLRRILSSENLTTALFVTLKVKKEANKPDDINESLCKRVLNGYPKKGLIWHFQGSGK